MNQQNFGGENYQTETGSNNTNFFGGQHQHYHPEAHPEASSPAEGIPCNIKLQRTQTFVGRSRDLEELHDLLQQQGRVAISAVQGMGGIGKTELALQYALGQREQGAYAGGVCWLEGREELGIQILSFASSQLQLEPPTELDLVNRIGFCWRHWRSGQVLVVCDDLQNYADLKPYLPSDDRFHFLLTSRRRLQVPTLELGVLSEAEALDLLRSYVTDGRIDQQLEQAQQVCRWLGYLPLALELVGRYLAQKPETAVTTLWQRLQDKRLAAQALKNAHPEMTAKLGVAAAFELSWQALGEPENGEAAQQVALLLSAFGLAPLRWDWVVACLPTWNPTWDEEKLEDCRDMLCGLHLLDRLKQPGQYQLHQLLWEFFAAKRSEVGRSTLDTETELRRSVVGVLMGEARQIEQTR